VPDTVNRVILLGTAATHVELRAVPGGTVAWFQLATTSQWTDPNTKLERTRVQWHRVVAETPALVRFAESRIRRDALIYVDGFLRTRNWTSGSGAPRSAQEIIAREIRAL